MKKRTRAGIIIAAIIVVAVVGFFVIRGRIAAGAAKTSTTAAAAPTIVKVTRGNLNSSITASGQLQPNTITTTRPDSNMPTRKLVKILVKEGQHVVAGQALAEVDPSGLEFDLQGARANYESQKARLANLQAKPQGMDLAAAQSTLSVAKNALDTAQENYNSTKTLADKGLTAKNNLNVAERSLSAARASYDSAQLSYDNAGAQNADADVQSQQSAVSSAQSALQKAQLIYDSITIRSPLAGMVAEISVNVGDLISPSTALMTVVNADPMWLLAQVNENDMVQLKLGQTATVTPAGYPDLFIKGKVTQIDLHAQVQANVSVFTATIEVPNKDGKLLWGMNADAEIAVLSLNSVLTLPVAAIKTSNGASTVTIIDGGQMVSWDVQTGATDGTKTQILAGLDEGSEVVIQRKSSSTATTTTQRTGGPGGMGAVFGILR